MFEKIIEERIKEAQRNGEFDDLPGKGKPLDFSRDPNIPPDLRLAYKVLKNADYLPPEIEIKKDIRRMEDLLAEQSDASEKYRILKKINFLILKLNSMRNTPVNFEMPQYYSSKLAEKLDSKTS